ncbi:uncharacterized protein LOC118824213 [Colossoma macropomum]|uniref:uncharacterized protein LOC118824213 n=1 Tax=Colossoma macropomum TaxID=42526 RepID=UPI0018649CD7|nr:uncharacterized protein LOC118824213 [Colossoma macropomum]
MAEISEKKKDIKVEFKADLNLRDMTEISVDGKHLSLEELRKHIDEDPTIWTKICHLGRRDTDNIKAKSRDKPKILDYLDKTVPEYPTPVEFHVSSVAHVTTKEPFKAILESEKIKPPNTRPPNTEFSWWTLAINEEEIKSAEKLYLENEKIEMTETFLKKFTTSPAFQHDISRYGNYRFTFPLAELMELYKEQNCGGKEPVLRVFKTMFYKQEIVYAVLIHSPQDSKRFGDLPLLEDSKFARYKNGQIIWDAQAISSDHQFELSVDTNEARLTVKCQRYTTYYVWDNVCLAFHLPSHKALKVPRKRLIEALDVCELHEKNLHRCEDPTMRGTMFADAKKLVDSCKKELEDNKDNVNALKYESEEE